MTEITAIRRRFRTVDRVRIRHAEKRRPAWAHALAHESWSESVYALAPAWETLADHARLFAVDLAGFGASVRRDDLLSPRAMGEFLARLICRLHHVTAEIWRTPRSWVEKSYPKVIHFNEVDKGGHFAAWEEPEPFAAEMRAGLRSLPW
jgi:pimeloyl-ACP methyl ester carboxylesterase